MFVINANANGSASATAYASGGGGNSTATSASGYYDTPMDGSTYNMFDDSCTTYIQGVPRTSGVPTNVYQTNINTFTGRNGNNPNESSVLDFAKVRRLDVDVLYPDNEKSCCKGGTGNGNQFAYRYDIGITCSSCSKAFPTHNLDEITSVDLGEIPHIIHSVVASRREFCGGEKVGRKINTYMKYDYFDFRCCFTHGSVGCNAVGNTKYYLKCPIISYIDLGVLHTDGTKDVLIHKEIKSPYYTNARIEDGSFKADLGNDVTDVESMLINGKETTTGVITCPGDRTYYEFGSCPFCYMYDVYTTTKTCETASQSYGCVMGGEYIAFVTGSNTHHTGCIYCKTTKSGDVESTFACCCENCLRFSGIQFSIE